MEEEKRSPRFTPYFIQIPLDILFDDNIIPLAKQLYWCIKLLDDKASGCFASNGYFAAIFNVTDT